MNLFKNYIHQIILYDFIIKFNPIKFNQFPKIIKIVLRFNLKNNNTFNLISAILALELISNKKTFICLKKSSKNIKLKIKLGVPIGCKVTLRKCSMFRFLINLFFINFPKSSFISKIISKDTKKSNSICFKFTDFFVFKNIEDNYSLFNTLNNLNVSLITNSKNYTLFLSNYIKIPSK